MEDNKNVEEVTITQETNTENVVNNANLELEKEKELLKQEIDQLIQDEEDDKKRRKLIIILILLLLILILIIFVVSYSMFDYTKRGDTDNTVTSGEIKFLYTENTGVGNGINITNAFPVSDEVGKGYSTENYVFDFKITADVPKNVDVPYEVTARMSKDSTLPSDVVKIYLVERNGNNETEISTTVNNGIVKRYSELTDTSINVGTYDDGSKIMEKTLYRDVAIGKNYEKDFRLRMWIAEDTDFSGIEQEDGTMLYPYNGKKFTTTVNVYSINE